MYKYRLLIPLLVFSTALSAQMMSPQALDPTKPDFLPVAKKAEGETENKDAEIVLTFIRISPVKNRAILNDTWLSEGDQILGYTVESITKKSVMLRRGGETKELRMSRSSIKK